MINEISENNKQKIVTAPGTFKLVNNHDYREWREQKLSLYPKHKEQLVVNISSLESITDEQLNLLSDNCAIANMAVYQCAEQKVNTSILRNFASKFGLHQIDHHLCTEDDGVSKLSVADNDLKEEFIPYSNRAIGWHTDGYYNDVSQRILSLLLHCEQPAIEGGENSLIDHEMIYILLRDINTDYIDVLMQPDCMTIPAYAGNNGQHRPQRTGPVFLIEQSTGKLHMRYTARKKNIIWKSEPLLQKAITILTEILNDAKTPVFQHRLLAGQGLISNNVLHTRTGFIDQPEQRRLLYRARFLDRIAGT